MLILFPPNIRKCLLFKIWPLDWLTKVEQNRRSWSQNPDPSWLENHTCALVIGNNQAYHKFWLPGMCYRHCITVITCNNNKVLNAVEKIKVVLSALLNWVSLKMYMLWLIMQVIVQQDKVHVRFGNGRSSWSSQHVHLHLQNTIGHMNWINRNMAIHTNCIVGIPELIIHKKFTFHPCIWNRLLRYSIVSVHVLYIASICMVL